MSPDNGYHTAAVEALILASPEPLAAGKIAQVIEEMSPAKVNAAVAELNNKYMESGLSFRIREIAGGFQFYILPDYVGYIDELFTRRRKMRLTRAALETMAIVAYKQPVTKTEVEHIRGVAADGVIQNLMEKQLITITGRASTVGKPLQYGTTDEFLKFFGLPSLDALPRMAEIEEMIASAMPKPQVELPLPEPPDDNAIVKLNIADGTFDPKRRELLDEAVEALSSAVPADIAEIEDELPNESSEEPPAEEGQRTLVLKQGTDAAPDEESDAVEGEDGDTEADIEEDSHANVND